MRRAALFLVAAAAVFAAALALGRVLDVGERSVAQAAHADEPDHVEPLPAGLAVAQDGYRLVTTRSALRVGRPQELSFRILGPDGRAVRGLEVEHERRLHLIVVRRELDWYVHVHPEERPDGTWATPLRLPVDGVYRVFADFTAAGVRRTLGIDLFGYDGARGFVRESQQRYEASLHRDGDRVELSIRHGGNPVRLQTYLGALGHLVVLRAGDLAYVHAHAAKERLSFDVPFPSRGSYRLFLQFKVGGSVQLASLGVRL